MSTHSLHFMIKPENFLNIFLNICFLKPSQVLSRDSKNKVVSATVNEPSVFESFKLTVNRFLLHNSLCRRQSKSLQLLHNHLMKGYGLLFCYFPWSAHRHN